MAIIEIADEKYWKGARWVFLNILEACLPSIVETRWREAIGASIEDNLGYFDMREMSEAERARFADAVSALLSKYRDGGPSTMADPAFHAGFVARIEDLVTLLGPR